MTRYVYTAWFQDQSADPSDQDYEWVACIFIAAETASDAKNWGDHLAKSYSVRNPDNVFLRSEKATTMDDPTWIGVTDWRGPVVVFGQEASDEYIGW
jgi:hypothetical protein